MPELAEVEKPKVAGYVNPRPKNKNKERIEEAEKELEQLSLISFLRFITI